MSKLEKILVVLDQSPIDADLIKTAAYISKVSQPAIITFMNVIRDFSLDDELEKEFPNLLEGAIEERKKTLQKEIETHYDYQGDTEIAYVVKRGQATRTIMKFTAEHDIDLVIAGKKNEKKGGGILINRLARRLDCNLLIVPKDSKIELNAILVPVDFSEYAHEAMKLALEIARETSNEVKIIAQNVFQVPSGYHYTGKSYNEFAEVMKEHAAVNYKKFMKDLDTDGIEIETLYSLDKNEDPMTLVRETAKKVNADGIIIGAKGRSSATAFFIGSMAERLINMDLDCPITVVRPKGKRAGILEYLKEI